VLERQAPQAARGLGLLAGQCIAYRPPSDSTVRSCKPARLVAQRPILATSTSTRSIVMRPARIHSAPREPDARPEDDPLRVQPGRDEQPGTSGTNPSLQVRVRA
jgi:hypothetical protein